MKLEGDEKCMTRLASEGVAGEGRIMAGPDNFQRMPIEQRRARSTGELGRDGHEITAIRITVLESPSASAWHEAPLW